MIEMELAKVIIRDQEDSQFVFLREKQGTRSFPIVIGAFLSLTGPLATFGQTTERGARMAIDELNQSGGVHGMDGDLAARVRAEDLTDVVQEVGAHRLLVLLEARCIAGTP